MARQDSSELADNFNVFDKEEGFAWTMANEVVDEMQKRLVAMVVRKQ